MSRGLPFRKYSFNLLLVLCFSNELSLCFTTCDVLICSRHMENLLSHTREDGTETLSRHMKAFLKCAGECYHDLFPNFIPKFEDSLKVSEKIFNSDSIFYLNDNWECVAQHSVPLLTCLAVTQSMKTTHLNGKASRLLTCKKATAMLNCPQEILIEKCGETTSDAMDDIFNIALKSKVANECQGVSSGDLANLQTHYELGNKFLKMAACVDLKKTIFKKCFQEFLTDSYAVRKYLCCEYGDLNKCIARDSSECISMFANASFFRSVLSLGEDKCNSIEDCPQENTNENAYNFEDHNSDLFETSTQELNLFSSETLAAGPLKIENENSLITEHVHTIHENNTQTPNAHAISSNTTFILNEVEKAKDSKETNRSTFPQKQGTKTKIEVKNVFTNENAKFTSTSVSDDRHREFVNSRTVPSPCTKVKMNTIFVLLVLLITIFH